MGPRAVLARVTVRSPRKAVRECGTQVLTLGVGRGCNSAEGAHVVHGVRFMKQQRRIGVRGRRVLVSVALVLVSACGGQLDDSNVEPTLTQACEMRGNLLRLNVRCGRWPVVWSHGRISAERAVAAELSLCTREFDLPGVSPAALAACACAPS